MQNINTKYINMPKSKWDYAEEFTINNLYKIGNI